MPRRDAIVDEAGALTYLELDDAVDRFSRALRSRGITAGDKVAYLLWNQRELFIAYFAIARLGALTVSLNFRLTAEELSYQLVTAGCKAIVVDAELAELASQAIAITNLKILQIVAGGSARPHQLAFADALQSEVEDMSQFPIVSAEADSGIWFTSGTTGRPKGAVVKHRSAVAAATLTAISLTYPADVRALAVAPLFHRGAMENIALSIILIGGTHYLFKKLNASQTLEYLEKYQINVSFIVPTMAWQLVNEPSARDKKLPELTHWISASAPLPPVLAERVQKTFGLSNGILNVYGITEMLLVSHCASEMLTKKPGTAGLPAPATQVIIYENERGVLPAGEIGEILVSGPTAFSYYLDNETATREASITLNGTEWYRSGDLGVIDVDGYLTIKDRKKDMIISGGENVYCAEVELALIEHPAVKEVAVVGVADEKWGEIVVAAIVKSMDDRIDVGDLARSCSSLASYKRPREIVCFEALPRNSFGKVRKDLVRAMASEQLLSKKKVRVSSS
jgi:fatty-acyl-CoA synthase